MSLAREFRRQGDYLFKRRGWLPVPILFLGIGLFVAEGLVRPGTWHQVEHSLGNLLSSLGPWIGLLGLAIRCYTIGHTPAGTSGRNIHGQVASTVNTTGIYSLVRHPLYLGNFFMWLGVACLTEHVWFVLLFVVCYWLYYERIMYAEETFLIEKYGETYLKWSARTPAFIPSLASWQPPSLPFSWKNVVKREMTGLYLLVLIIAFFRILASVLAQREWTAAATRWSVVIVVATGVFLAVRWVRKQTTLLEVAGR